MTDGRIRALALALIQRCDRDGLLVERGPDKTKAQRFTASPGGGVAFGEAGEAALRRELREELGVDATHVVRADGREHLHVPGSASLGRL